MGDWLDTMINFIDYILNFFRPCFSRKAAFHWFVILVTGFLLRSDHLGLTSVIRDLALRADTYESMLHFFRASSMIQDAYEAATVLGNSLLLLDRYFLSVTALEMLTKLNQSQTVGLDILTKAKANCIAYEKAPKKKPGRGRPPKKGKTIHLRELFDSHVPLFLEKDLTPYGKKESVRYHCINLL